MLWTRKMKRCVKQAVAYRQSEVYDGLAARQSMKELIEEKTEDGKIAVVSSSRDCDLYEVTGRTRTLPALVIAVVKFSNDLYDDAEGPCSYYITSPSEAAGVSQQGRDIAAEMMNY